MTDQDRPLIPSNGGYRELRCFILAEIIYDGTVAFTGCFLRQSFRTVDQMIQAARSGSRNIAEGSRDSAISKKSELKLLGYARGSLDELLLDYESFLRQNKLELWNKDHPKAVFIRDLSKRNALSSQNQQNRADQSNPTKSGNARAESYELYRPFIEEKSAETAANTLICLIHQTNFLLDRLLRKLEQSFAEEGGFTEKLYRERTKRRNERHEKESD